MGTEIASAYVSLLPSAQGFGSRTERELGPEIDTAGKRSGTRFGRVFAAAGGLLAAAGIGSFLKDSIGEAREAQKTGALTESIIKSTGGAAKISAAQVGDLATALSNKTGIDDEAIQSGSNLLLTFKNVKREGEGLNDVFGRATAAAVDLSASGFGDINGASKQLGKALNDPVKGISALSRSGVTFTGTQQELIKSLVEGGDVLSAQKIILKEVESQVGGAAEATATSGEKAAVAFGNLKETVGTALLPVIDRAADLFTNSIAPALTDAVGYVQELGPAFGAAGDRVTSALKPLQPILESVGGAIRSGLIDVIPKVREVFADLQPALSEVGGLLRENVLQLIPQVQAVLGALVTSLRPVVTAVASQLIPAARKIGAIFADVVVPAALDFRSAVVKQLVPVIEMIGPVVAKVVPLVAQLGTYVATKLVPVFSAVAAIVTQQVIPILGTMAQFVIGKVIPAMVAIWASIAQRLKPVFDQLVATFRSTVLPALSQLLATFRRYQPEIQKVILVVIRVQGFFAKLAATVLGKVLPPLIRLAGFIIKVLIGALSRAIAIVGGVVRAVSRFAGALGTAKGAVSDFAGKVSRFFTTVNQVIQKTVNLVITAVKAIPGKILGLVGDMVTAGKEFVGGLFRGVVAAAKNVGGFIGDLARAVIDAVNSALHLPLQINFDKGPFHVHATLIPAFAKGTLSAPGGLALVGEEGPELVELPRGAAVRTAAQTRRLAQAPRRLGAPAASGAGSGGRVGGTTILRVGEREFVAYMAEVADDRVSSAVDLSSEQRRARW